MTKPPIEPSGPRVRTICCVTRQVDWCLPFKINDAGEELVLFIGAIALQSWAMSAEGNGHREPVKMESPS